MGIGVKCQYEEAYKRFETGGGYFYTREIVWTVSGEKAGKFLQGQLTNDILALSIGEGNYNLLLTMKGKIVADLFVYRAGEAEFYLCLKKEFEGKVVDHLQKLAPLSRVTITEPESPLQVIHICGSPPSGATRSLLPGYGEPPPPGHGEPGRTMRLGFPGYDLIIPPDQLEECLEKFREQKIHPISDELQEILRVENGICRMGVDATEENLPHEARLLKAVSFTKGCYLGQEIVARLQYRGHVNKILAGLGLDTEDVPPVISPALTSCIFSPKLGKPLGLGYVPYALNKPGQKFEIGGNRAEIIELPLNN